MRIFWKIREEGDLEETIEIKELFNPYWIKGYHYKVLSVG